MVKKCAECGFPLQRGVRNYKSKTPSKDHHVRLPSEVWLAHLLADPFCSTECARKSYGTELPEARRGEKVA